MSQLVSVRQGEQFLWQAFVGPTVPLSRFGAQLAFLTPQLLAVGMPGAVPTTADPASPYGAVAFVTYNTKKNVWSIDQSVW